MKEIREWEDLIGLENEKYKVEVEENGCFWVVNKEDEEEMIYLSTHFFYKSATHYEGFLEKYFKDVKVIR